MGETLRREHGEKPTAAFEPASASKTGSNLRLCDETMYYSPAGRQWMAMIGRALLVPF